MRAHLLGYAIVFGRGERIVRSIGGGVIGHGRQREGTRRRWRSEIAIWPSPRNGSSHDTRRHSARKLDVGQADGVFATETQTVCIALFVILPTAREDLAQGSRGRHLGIGDETGRSRRPQRVLVGIVLAGHGEDAQGVGVRATGAPACASSVSLILSRQMGRPGHAPCTAMMVAPGLRMPRPTAFSMPYRIRVSMSSCQSASLCGRG